MPEYIVKPGDCLASIAARFHLTLDSLWDHPDNQSLREERRDPYVLREGDRVHLPDPQPKTVKVAPGGRHTFMLTDTRCEFEVQLRLNGDPRKHEPWVLLIAGERITGTTDAEGTVRASIPARASEGVLELRDGRERFPFRFGDLDPIDTPRGLQGRLANLAYYRHLIDGDHGPWTARALRAFQRDHGVAVTGEADEPTLARLRTIYGR